MEYFSVMEVIVLFVCLVQLSYAVFVQTQFGWVQGTQTNDALVFYGIPYAQQPERWEHAVPPVPWGGIYDATKPRPMCLQPPCSRIDPPGTCQENMSENCLFVNVFVPPNARSGERKSVMVFIHGGDYTQMSGGAPAFNGEHFANKGDVILVTFNYRLGALGYFAFDNVSGNFGITDQRLALQWVYTNIGRFGGSRNITLFGQGSGATSVAIHMSSRKSLGYFRSAIIMSLPFSLPLKTSEQALALGQNLTMLLNCKDIECLRSKSPWDILDAQVNAFLPSGTMLQRLRPWGPFIDGDDVVSDVQTAFRRGQVHNIPLIIGTTTADGADLIFKTYPVPVNALEFETILTAMNPDQARLWYTLYTPQSQNETRRELIQFITDYVFTCPVRSIAASMTRINNTWVYAFGRSMDYLTGSEFAPQCALSACHGADLAYLFQNIGNLGFNYSMIDMQLSDEVLIYWSSFTKLNNPNGDLVSTEDGVLEWYRYTGLPPVIRPVLGIGHPQSSIQADYRGLICNLFDQNNFRV